MLLLDLPLEIFRDILVRVITERGIIRGLRLRLVNRMFFPEIISQLPTSRRSRNSPELQRI